MYAIIIKYAMLRVFLSMNHVVVSGSMIGDLYRNGREFCEKRNYQCEPMESQNCFTFDSTLDKFASADRKTPMTISTILSCALTIVVLNT